MSHSEDRACCVAVRQAACDGNLAILRALFESNPDPEGARLTIACARSWGNSALRIAARNGHLEIIQYFIETVGLTIEDVRADGNDLLNWACIQGHLNVVEYLIEVIGLTAEDVRASGDGITIALTAGSGHTNILRYLFGPDGPGLTVEDAREYDNCALRFAALGGRLAVVQFLLGPDGPGLTIEDARADNNYALRWAGHADVVAYLTEIGLKEIGV